MEGSKCQDGEDYQLGGQGDFISHWEDPIIGSNQTSTDASRPGRAYQGVGALGHWGTSKVSSFGGQLGMRNDLRKRRRAARSKGEDKRFIFIMLLLLLR